MGQISRCSSHVGEEAIDRGTKLGCLVGEIVRSREHLVGRAVGVFRGLRRPRDAAGYDGRTIRRLPDILRDFGRSHILPGDRRSTP